MKRITLLFFSVLLLMYCCSCKKDPAPIVTDFSADFTAQCNGVKLTGEIVSNKNNMLSLTLNTPKAMQGYKYIYNADSLLIEYDEIKVETQPNYLPKTAFSSVIHNIIVSLGKENNCYLDTTTDLFANYKGSCDSGEYALTTQYSMGTISEMRIDSLDFFVKFKAVKVNK